MIETNSLEDISVEKRVSIKEKKVYQCEVHKAEYKEKSGLKYHIESVHESKKPYQCSKCDKKFTTKQLLDRHNSSIHEDNRPFQCTAVFNL